MSKLKFDNLPQLYYTNGFGYRNDFVNEAIYQQLFEQFKEYIDSSTSTLISMNRYYSDALLKEPEDKCIECMRDILYIMLKSKEDDTYEYYQDDNISFSSRDAYSYFTALIKTDK